MPLAPVDNNGTVLFYEDSGVPNISEPYTTLVMFHGFMYGWDVFKKIVPLAHHHNLRIIRVSNHDYPPSSLFTPSELGDFASPDLKTQAGVLEKLGIEIASLLVYLVDTLKLPPISVSWDSTVVGGISVLGWSLGAYFPVALLGSASALPKGDQELLGKYLRSAILYDPSIFSVGVPIPGSVFEPDRPKGLDWSPMDLKLSLQERIESFGPWVSSYYTPIHDISTLDLEKQGERLRVQDLDQDTFQSLGLEEWTKITSLEKFDPKELEDISSPESAVRALATWCAVDPSVARENLRLALGLDISSDRGSRTEPLVWPGCKMVAVWCDMTLPDCSLASAGLVKLLREEGCKVKRKVEVEKFTGVNHFPHWDEPGKAISFLAERI